MTGEDPGVTPTASGVRLAFSARRSCFFSRSSGETQWVRYAVSMFGLPLRLKRKVGRPGRRAGYAVALAYSPFPAAQARNRFIATEMRLRLAWTTRSR